MIKIAITDDHPLLLEGLRNILSNQQNLQVVDCYASAQQLQEALKTTEIDILLLDINLSDTNSIELIKPFKKKYPDMHKQLEFTRDILTLINSLSKSNINIITKFLHFALMINHKLRISIVELSKLIKVDTDILQYITSLESLLGMSDIDLPKCVKSPAVQGGDE